MKKIICSTIVLLISFYCFGKAAKPISKDDFEELTFDNYHIKDGKLYYTYTIRQVEDSAINHVSIKFERSYELSNESYQQFVNAIKSSDILSIKPNSGGCIDCRPIKISGKTFGKVINISAYYSYLSESDKEKATEFYKALSSIDNSKEYEKFIASLPTGKYSEYGSMIIQEYWKYNNEWLDMKEYPLVLLNDKEIAPNRVEEFEKLPEKYIVIKHDRNSGQTAIYGTRAYNGVIKVMTHAYHKDLMNRRNLKAK